MENFKNFINGSWVEPESGKYSENINPANTDEILGMFPLSNRSDVDKAVKAAQEAFKSWSQVPGPERGRILYRFADLLEAAADEVAEILTKEEGKIFGEAKGEVMRAVVETRYMAGEASRLNGEHYPSSDASVDVVRRRIPLGPVGVITPWNFPVVSPVRKISPALACGDTVVFKPATATPWTGLKLTELYAQAGVPAGVINTICGAGSAVGSAIAEAKEIRGITFTGSTGVGRSLNRACAEDFKKIQLEMGGKNPALVFNAEDLDVVASQIVSAAFGSSGQRCTAVSRVIVSESEHDALVEKMVDLLKEWSVGDGMDSSVKMGPLVSQDQIDTMERFMEIAREEQLEVVIGGAQVESKNSGFYFAPTLVTGVTKDSPLAKEEIFGPILSVLKVNSFEEGMQLCNDTPYGLGSCVFTKTIQQAKQFAQKVEAGMIHINHGTASQPHVPFGGVKESGFGAYSIGPTAREFYMIEKVVYTK
jgi:aldehyde dehydrogenase (NAD+)